MTIRLFILCLIISTPAHTKPLTLHLAEGKSLQLPYSEIENRLPMYSFSTSLPWYANEQSFVGFRLQDLIQQYQISTPAYITLSALNDYRADVDWSDITHFNPIIAYKRNGREMRVREKGPYWFVFDLKRYPALDNHIYYEKMVWQISDIRFHNKLSGLK